MEFDMNITYSSDFSSIRYYDGSTGKVYFNPYNDLGIVSENWYHIKLERKGDIITPIVNGITLTAKSKTITGSINKFSLITDNTKMTNMKYKNFVYYPI